jgi:hypothetical protein
VGILCRNVIRDNAWQGEQRSKAGKIMTNIKDIPISEIMIWLVCYAQLTPDEAAQMPDDVARKIAVFCNELIDKAPMPRPVKCGTKRGVGRLKL